MENPRRRPDTRFPIFVAFVGCVTINLAFVPTRDFAVLYLIPVLVASLLAPPVAVVATAIVGFAVDVTDLLWDQDPVGSWLIGLTTFVIVGAVCVPVSFQRREIGRRAADAEALAETLRAVSAQLEAIIQASPLAIIALDAADRVTLWNPGATRIFGWTAREV
jgi:PAS domain-containing protein